jgi:ribosomal protein S18 acetylase RimI-like enzyme
MNITVRRLVPGQDDAARTDIVNRAFADRDDHVRLTLDDIRRWDQSPIEQRRHRFIAELDGVPVATGFAQVDPDRAEKKGFMVGPNVVPEHRRKGIGTALAQAMMRDLRERGMEQVEIQERERPDVCGFLAALGFRPVRAFSQMRRSLQALPPTPAHAEVGVVEPTDENLRAVVAIENEAFKEHYNYRPLPLEQLRFMVKACADEGTLRYLSLARLGGNPVGYLLYGIDPRENAEHNRHRGGPWDLGVLKPHRRRGVASALLTRAMEHLRSQGMDEAELYVDDLNATGARRVYEKLGFTLTHRDLAHLKDLRPAAEEA